MLFSHQNLISLERKENTERLKSSQRLEMYDNDLETHNDDLEYKEEFIDDMRLELLKQIKNHKHGGRLLNKKGQEINRDCKKSNDQELANDDEKCSYQERDHDCLKSHPKYFSLEPKTEGQESLEQISGCLGNYLDYLEFARPNTNCLEHHKDCLEHDNDCLEHHDDCIEHYDDCLEHDNDCLEHHDDCLKHDNDCLEHHDDCQEYLKLKLDGLENQQSSSLIEQNSSFQGAQEQNSSFLEPQEQNPGFLEPQEQTYSFLEPQDYSSAFLETQEENSSLHEENSSLQEENSSLQESQDENFECESFPLVLCKGNTPTIV